MDDLRVDAVAMVRDIRDRGYEIVKDMSPEEEVRYFQEESARFRAEMAEQRLAGRQPRG
jgi:hypothetical protein